MTATNARTLEEAPMSVRIKHGTADPKAGLSLAELEHFITQARQSGAPDTAKLTVNLTWSGRVREVEVEFDEQPAGETAG